MRRELTPRTDCTGACIWRPAGSCTPSPEAFSFLHASCMLQSPQWWRHEIVALRQPAPPTLIAIGSVALLTAMWDHGCLSVVSCPARGKERSDSPLSSAQAQAGLSGAWLIPSLQGSLCLGWQFPYAPQLCPPSSSCLLQSRPRLRFAKLPAGRVLVKAALAARDMAEALAASWRFSVGTSNAWQQSCVHLAAHTAQRRLGELGLALVDR
jgi:hypothetical protein